MNYYQEELDKVDFMGQYATTVKFRDVNGSTQWMDVNCKSADEIIKKLSKIIEFYKKTR